jgi:glycosyltransferase involved in cell wall biosynthesis
MNQNGTRRLRIAQVAPLWGRVPPETYGGSELIVSLLTEELIRNGHEVTLFATGDSRTRGKLHAIGGCSVAEAMKRGEAHEYEHYANASLSEALRASSAFDLIHCHLGFARIPLGINSPIPVLHTLHIPLGPDDRWTLRRYPRVPVVAISRYQASDIPSECDRVTVVHHGIDFGAYTFSSRPGSYLVFLARMGPQKSPADAIKVAKRAGLPLVLAGKPQNADEERYFQQQVKPHLDGQRVRYVGDADHAQKNELLKNAAALLFPIRGAEAFGLVMVEAMACGTPVLAFRTASVGEIVDEGVTGYTALDDEGLAAKVEPALALDRATIRAHAERRFSHTRMARDYMAIYHSLVRG